MDDRYYNLWSTDNDRLDANDEVVIKTVYDPSPVGYSLPASNAFTGFTTTGQNEGAWNIPATPELKAKFNVKGDWDKGWLFYTKPNKQGGTFFFPACGYRSYNPGSLGDVPSSGFCWIAGPDYRGYGRYLGFNSGNVYPLYGMNRSLGFAVRSAEEKKTHKFNIKQEMENRYYNLWSTDNDKTDANDEVVIKSVYDPSPVGYSLPASNAFTGFTTTGGNTNNPSELNIKDNFDKGYYFYTKPNKQGNIFWFPASGSRHYDSRSLDYVPTFGSCWVAGPYNRSRVRGLDFGSGEVSPLYDSHRSSGFSVRSAEEREMEVCVLGSCNVLTSAALHPHHAMRGSPPFMMSWMTQSHSVTPYNSQED